MQETFHLDRPAGDTCERTGESLDNLALKWPPIATWRAVLRVIFLSLLPPPPDFPKGRKARREREDASVTQRIE